MSNVKVAVRTRPLNKKEVDKGAKFIVDITGDTLSLTNPKVVSLSEYGDSRERVKHFAFDYCYNSYDRPQSSSYASQEVLFQDLGTEVLQAAFEGYNACLFAYGQTSTGKTYTMMGQPGEIGLIPRICEGLFARVDDCEAEEITFRVDISYLEVYNERVRDLLNGKQSDRYTLKVREHPKEGPYVQDLSRHLVKDNPEIQTLLEKGNDLRVTASTHMHDHSSRSHAIITITFTQASIVDDLPSEIISKINLVDLAGSERADTTVKAGYKGRLKEGSNINKSLVTLGNVIKSLAEKSLLSWSSESVASLHNTSMASDTTTATSPRNCPRKQRTFYIPYRDSVLTWLLKDSLGGNSKTFMIATITPASSYYSESLSTLRYAQRAKSIINKPKINEDPNVTIIREMKREIERLRQMLATAQMSSQHNEIVFIVPIKRKQHDSESDSQAGPLMSLQESGTNTFLFEKIQENEDRANQLTQTWLDKWQETQDILDESDLSIRRPLGRRTSSQGVIVDSQLPHLIGMDDDILSTGVIIYHLKEGKTRIGRDDAKREQDIGLCGPGVQTEHCIIKNVMGTVTIYPNRGAMCAVNGIDLKEPQRLTQGDVILIGKTHMFRFNHPEEAAKLREHRRVQSLSDSMGSMSDLVPAGCSSPTPNQHSEAASPARLSHLRLFSTSRSSSTSDICGETSESDKAEEARLEAARRELEEIREAQRKTEDNFHEQEDTAYRLHEIHRAEIEGEKQCLAELIEKAQADRALAEDEMIAARQRLEEEREEHARMLELELEKLARIQEKQRRNSRDSEDNSGDDSKTDDADIFTPTSALRVRKTSLEGKMKDLVQAELLQKWSERETEVVLARHEEELEEEFEQTQEQIMLHQQKIMEIEDSYKATDASHYEEIASKVKELNALQHKEEQLEMFLEEKHDLLKVEEYQPQPLRGACSAELLTEVDIAESFAEKLSDRRGSDGDLPLRGYMFAADSSISLDKPKDTYVTKQRSPSSMSVDSLSGNSEGQPGTSKEDLSKKISSRAQKVTDRLYKPPPNKPRKPSANMSTEPLKRGSTKSPVKGKGTKEPPLSKRVSTRDKPKLVEKMPTKKPETFQRITRKPSLPDRSKQRPKQIHKSPVNVKRSPMKSPGPLSPTFKEALLHKRTMSDGGLMSSRMTFRPAGFRLRQVSSASSLASVPEDDSEDAYQEPEEVTQSETDIRSAVVLRKKSRRLSPEDAYKRHSAPVGGDRLARIAALNNFSPGSLQRSKRGLSSTDRQRDDREMDFELLTSFSDPMQTDSSETDGRRQTSSTESRSDSEEDYFSAPGSLSNIPVIVITDSDDAVLTESPDEATFQDITTQLPTELESTDVSMDSSTVTIASTVIENPEYMSGSDEGGSEKSVHNDTVIEDSSVKVESKREHVDTQEIDPLYEAKRPKQDVPQIQTADKTKTNEALQKETPPEMVDSQGSSVPATEQSFSCDSLDGRESPKNQGSTNVEGLDEVSFEDSLELPKKAMVVTNELDSEAGKDQPASAAAAEPGDSDFSLDSLQDAKEKLETLQEVLQQLKPKSSIKSNSVSRRTRQRAQVRHNPSVDSDASEHLSDDSLGSESCSKSSSRPNSASKRRRRPQTKVQDPPVKKSKGVSSEEYATSDSDGVYSDDSLAQSDERILDDPVPKTSALQNSKSTAEKIADISNSIQQLTKNVNCSVKGPERCSDLEDRLDGRSLPTDVKSQEIVVEDRGIGDFNRLRSASVKALSEPPSKPLPFDKSRLGRLSRSTTTLTTFDGKTEEPPRPENEDQDVKKKFVIHKDELNVVYNVQRTEYNTLGLRPVKENLPKQAKVYTVEQPILKYPESIDLTVTETKRTQKEDRIHTTHTEQVIFRMPGTSDDLPSGDVHVREKAFMSAHDYQYNQITDGADASRESSIDRTFKDENTKSYVQLDKCPDGKDSNNGSNIDPSHQDSTGIVHPAEQIHTGSSAKAQLKEDPFTICEMSKAEADQNTPISDFQTLSSSQMDSAGELANVLCTSLPPEASSEESMDKEHLVFVNSLPAPQVVFRPVDITDSAKSLDETPNPPPQVHLPVLVSKIPSHDTSSEKVNPAVSTIYVGPKSSKVKYPEGSMHDLVQDGKQVFIPLSLNLLQDSLATYNVATVLQTVCATVVNDSEVDSFDPCIDVNRHAQGDNHEDKTSVNAHFEDGSICPSVIVVNRQPYLNFRKLHRRYSKSKDETGENLKCAKADLHQTLENMLKALKAAENMSFDIPGSHYARQRTPSAGNITHKQEQVPSTDLVDFPSKVSNRDQKEKQMLETDEKDIFDSKLVYIDGLPYVQIEKVDHIPERACFEMTEEKPSTSWVENYEPLRDSSVYMNVPDAREDKFDSVSLVPNNLQGKHPPSSSMERTEMSASEYVKTSDIVLNLEDQEQPVETESPTETTEKSASEYVKTCHIVRNMENQEHAVGSESSMQTTEESASEYVKTSDIVCYLEDQEQSAGTELPKPENEIQTTTERKRDVLLKLDRRENILLKPSEPIATGVDPQRVCRELEKKIAKLEKHVGRVSDSAISSDYTDGESVLSPKGSRLFVNERPLNVPKKVLFAHDLQYMPTTQSMVCTVQTDSQDVMSVSQENQINELASRTDLQTASPQKEADDESFYLANFNENPRGLLSPSTPDSALGSSVFLSGGSNMESGSFSSASQSSNHLVQTREPHQQQMEHGVSAKGGDNEGFSQTHQEHFHPLLSVTERIQEQDNRQELPTSIPSCRETKGSEDQPASGKSSGLSPTQSNTAFPNEQKANKGSSEKQQNRGSQKEGGTKQKYTGPHRKKDHYTKAMIDTPTNDKKVGKHRSRNSSSLGVDIDSICSLPKEAGGYNIRDHDQVFEETEEVTVSGKDSYNRLIPDGIPRPTGELTMNKFFTVFSSGEETASLSSGSDEEKVKSPGTFQMASERNPPGNYQSRRRSSDHFITESLDYGIPGYHGKGLLSPLVSQEDGSDNLSVSAGQSQFSTQGSVLRSLQEFMEGGDQSVKETTRQQVSPTRPYEHLTVRSQAGSNQQTLGQVDRTSCDSAQMKDMEQGFISSSTPGSSEQQQHSDWISQNRPSNFVPTNWDTRSNNFVSQNITERSTSYPSQSHVITGEHKMDNSNAQQKETGVIRSSRDERRDEEQRQHSEWISQNRPQNFVPANWDTSSSNLISQTVSERNTNYPSQSQVILREHNMGNSNVQQQETSVMSSAGYGRRDEEQQQHSEWISQNRPQNFVPANWDTSSSNLVSQTLSERNTNYPSQSQVIRREHNMGNSNVQREMSVMSSAGYGRRDEEQQQHSEWISQNRPQTFLPANWDTSSSNLLSQTVSERGRNYPSQSQVIRGEHNMGNSNVQQNETGFMGSSTHGMRDKEQQQHSEWISQNRSQNFVPFDWVTKSSNLVSESFSDRNTSYPYREHKLASVIDQQNETDLQSYYPRDSMDGDKKSGSSINESSPGEGTSQQRNIYTGHQQPENEQDHHNQWIYQNRPHSFVPPSWNTNSNKIVSQQVTGQVKVIPSSIPPVPREQLRYGTSDSRTNTDPSGSVVDFLRVFMKQNEAPMQQNRTNDTVDSDFGSSQQQRLEKQDSKTARSPTRNTSPQIWNENIYPQFTTVSNMPKDTPNAFNHNSEWNIRNKSEKFTEERNTQVPLLSTSDYTSGSVLNSLREFMDRGEKTGSDDGGSFRATQRKGLIREQVEVDHGYLSLGRVYPPRNSSSSDGGIYVSQQVPTPGHQDNEQSFNKSSLTEVTGLEEDMEWITGKGRDMSFPPGWETKSSRPGGKPVMRNVLQSGPPKHIKQSDLVPLGLFHQNNVSGSADHSVRDFMKQRDVNSAYVEKHHDSEYSRKKGIPMDNEHLKDKQRQSSVQQTSQQMTNMLPRISAAERKLTDEGKYLDSDQLFTEERIHQIPETRKNDVRSSRAHGLPSGFTVPVPRSHYGGEGSQESRPNTKAENTTSNIRTSLTVPERRPQRVIVRRADMDSSSSDSDQEVARLHPQQHFFSHHDSDSDPDLDRIDQAIKVAMILSGKEFEGRQPSRIRIDSPRMLRSPPTGLLRLIPLYDIRNSQEQLSHVGVMPYLDVDGNLVVPSPSISSENRSQNADSDWILRNQPHGYTPKSWNTSSSPPLPQYAPGRAVNSKGPDKSESLGRPNSKEFHHPDASDSTRHQDSDEDWVANHRPKRNIPNDWVTSSSNIPSQDLKVMPGSYPSTGFEDNTPETGATPVLVFQQNGYPAHGHYDTAETYRPSSHAQEALNLKAEQDHHNQDSDEEWISKHRPQTEIPHSWNTKSSDTYHPSLIGRTGLTSPDDSPYTLDPGVNEAGKLPGSSRFLPENGTLHPSQKHLGNFPFYDRISPSLQYRSDRDIPDNRNTSSLPVPSDGTKGETGLLPFDTERDPGSHFHLPSNSTKPIHQTGGTNVFSSPHGSDWPRTNLKNSTNSLDPDHRSPNNRQRRDTTDTAPQFKNQLDPENMDRHPFRLMSPGGDHQTTPNQDSDQEWVFSHRPNRDLPEDWKTSSSHPLSKGVMGKTGVNPGDLLVKPNDTGSLQMPGGPRGTPELASAETGPNNLRSNVYPYGPEARKYLPFPDSEPSYHQDFNPELISKHRPAKDAPGDWTTSFSAPLSVNVKGRTGENPDGGSSEGFRRPDDISGSKDRRSSGNSSSKAFPDHGTTFPQNDTHPSVLNSQSPLNLDSDTSDHQDSDQEWILKHRPKDLPEDWNTFSSHPLSKGVKGRTGVNPDDTSKNKCENERFRGPGHTQGSADPQKSGNGAFRDIPDNLAGYPPNNTHSPPDNPSVLENMKSPPNQDSGQSDNQNSDQEWISNRRPTKDIPEDWTTSSTVPLSKRVKGRTGVNPDSTADNEHSNEHLKKPGNAQGSTDPHRSSNGASKDLPDNLAGHHFPNDSLTGPGQTRGSVDPQKLGSGAFRDVPDNLAAHYPPNNTFLSATNNNKFPPNQDSESSDHQNSDQEWISNHRPTKDMPKDWTTSSTFPLSKDVTGRTGVNPNEGENDRLKPNPLTSDSNAANTFPDNRQPNAYPSAFNGPDSEVSDHQDSDQEWILKYRPKDLPDDWTTSSSHPLSMGVKGRTGVNPDDTSENEGENGRYRRPDHAQSSRDPHGAGNEALRDILSRYPNNTYPSLLNNGTSPPNLDSETSDHQDLDQEWILKHRPKDLPEDWTTSSSHPLSTGVKGRTGVNPDDTSENEGENDRYRRPDHAQGATDPHGARNGELRDNPDNLASQYPPNNTYPSAFNNSTSRPNVYPDDTSENEGENDKYRRPDHAQGSRDPHGAGNEALRDVPDKLAGQYPPSKTYPSTLNNGTSPPNLDSETSDHQDSDQEWILKHRPKDLPEDWTTSSSHPLSMGVKGRTGVNPDDTSENEGENDRYRRPDHAQGATDPHGARNGELRDNPDNLASQYPPNNTYPSAFNNSTSRPKVYPDDTSENEGENDRYRRPDHAQGSRDPHGAGSEALRDIPDNLAGQYPPTKTYPSTLNNGTSPPNLDSETSDHQDSDQEWIVKHRPKDLPEDWTTSSSHPLSMGVKGRTGVNPGDKSENEGQDDRYRRPDHMEGLTDPHRGEDGALRDIPDNLASQYLPNDKYPSASNNGTSPPNLDSESSDHQDSDQEWILKHRPKDLPEDWTTSSSHLLSEGVEGRTGVNPDYTSESEKEFPETRNNEPTSPVTTGHETDSPRTSDHQDSDQEWILKNRPNNNFPEDWTTSSSHPLSKGVTGKTGVNPDKISEADSDSLGTPENAYSLPDSQTTLSNAPNIQQDGTEHDNLYPLDSEEGPPNPDSEVSDHQDSDQEWILKHRPNREIPDDWVTLSSELLSKGVKGRTGVTADDSSNDQLTDEEVSPDMEDHQHKDFPDNFASSSDKESNKQEEDLEWIINNRPPQGIIEPWQTSSSQLLGENISGKTGVVPDEETASNADSENQPPSTVSSDNQLSDQEWVSRNRAEPEFPEWVTHSSQLQGESVIGKTGVTVSDEEPQPVRVRSHSASVSEGDRNSVQLSERSLSVDHGSDVKDKDGRSLSNDSITWVFIGPPARVNTAVQTEGSYHDSESFSSDDESESYEPPLRHKYGIDDSVLPLSEKTVSNDNLPKMTREEATRRPHSSCGFVRSTSFESPPPEIDSIFPPRSSDEEITRYRDTPFEYAAVDGGLGSDDTLVDGESMKNIEPLTEQNVFFDTIQPDEPTEDFVKVVTRAVYPSRVNQSGRGPSAFLMEDIPALPESHTAGESRIPPVDNVSRTSRHLSNMPPSQTIRMKNAKVGTEKRKKKRSKGSVMVDKATAVTSKSVSRAVQSEGTSNEGAVKEFQVSDTQTDDPNWQELSDLMSQTNNLIRSLHDKIPEKETEIIPSNAVLVETKLEPLKIKDSSMQTSDNEDELNRSKDKLNVSVDSSTQTLLNESTQTDIVECSATQTEGTNTANTAVQTQVEVKQEKMDSTINMSVQTDEGVDLFSPNSSFNVTREVVVEDVPDLDISTDLQSLRDEHDRMMKLLKRAKSAREARKEALRNRNRNLPVTVLEEPVHQPASSPQDRLAVQELEWPEIPTFASSTSVQAKKPAVEQVPERKDIKIINTIDKDKELRVVLNVDSNQPGSDITSIVVANKSNSNDGTDVTHSTPTRQIILDRTTTTNINKRDGEYSKDKEIVEKRPHNAGVEIPVDIHTFGGNDWEPQDLRTSRVIHIQGVPENTNSFSTGTHAFDTTEDQSSFEFINSLHSRGSRGVNEQPSNSNRISTSEGISTIRDSIDFQNLEVLNRAVVREIHSNVKVNNKEHPSSLGDLQGQTTCVILKAADRNNKQYHNAQAKEIDIQHECSVEGDEGQPQASSSSRKQKTHEVSSGRKPITELYEADKHHHMSGSNVSVDKKKILARRNRPVKDILNSSDEFTQTDLDYLAMQQLAGASGKTHTTVDETSDPASMQEELERLQQERVEILDLLSLNYLPSSLTIELLEAKLNYCIGQTDLLLTAVEENWEADAADGAAMSENQQKVLSEDYISRYKQDLAQSKKTIASCIDKIERSQGRGRGRTRTRSRDLMKMKRKAELEAFKLERMREQNEFGRTRSASPYKNTYLKSPRSVAENDLTAASSESSLTAAQVMSPREHKEYLVQLRKKLVKTVAEDEIESLGRSLSPDLYWTPHSLNSSFHSTSIPDYSSSREVSPEFRASDYLYNFDGPNASSVHSVYRDATEVLRRQLYSHSVTIRMAPGYDLTRLPHRHLATEPERLLAEYQQTRRRASSEISQAREYLKPWSRQSVPQDDSGCSSLDVQSQLTRGKLSESGSNVSVSAKAVDEELEKMRLEYNNSPEEYSHLPAEYSRAPPEYSRTSFGHRASSSSGSVRSFHKGGSHSMTRRGSSLPAPPSRMGNEHRLTSLERSYLARYQSSSRERPRSSYGSYTECTRDVTSKSERSVPQSIHGIPKRSAFEPKVSSKYRRPKSATPTLSRQTPSLPSREGTPTSSQGSRPFQSDSDKNRYSSTRPIRSSDIKSRLQSKAKTSNT